MNDGPKTVFTGQTSAKGPYTLFFLIRNNDYIQCAHGDSYKRIPENYSYVQYSHDLETKIIDTWKRLHDEAKKRHLAFPAGTFFYVPGIHDSFYPYVIQAIQTGNLPTQFPCYPLPFPMGGIGATGPTESFSLANVKLAPSGAPYLI